VGRLIHQLIRYALFRTNATGGGRRAVRLPVASSSPRSTVGRRRA
jgi:hypothetical protein